MVAGPAVACTIVALSGCREKITQSQCEILVARYAQLVVREKMPTASAAQIREEQKHVRDESAGDENFRNCTTEVRPSEYKCAMAAQTSNAIEKCLE